MSSPLPFSVTGANAEKVPHVEPVSGADARMTCVLATPDSPSPADVETCTEWLAYAPFA